MAADGTLIFDTRIDSDGFNRGIKNASASLNGFKATLGKVAAAAAAAFSVKKIVEFGKQAIETASDLQEVQNVVDTAFGDTAYKMESFAKVATKQYGISELAAKKTGSTFMAMSVGVGVARDAASDMSVALTGLSADMASFYNVEQEVAATALKSVFTGETETLKQFGIVMTEANLEAYALSQGVTKSMSSMTQAEKTQLRYAYVMKQTALAQGDFAKTSDSWANQTRILSEKWKEFSATIGETLTNIVLPVVQTLNRALSKMIEYARSASDALSGLFGWETMAEASSTGLAEAAADSAESYASAADSAEEADSANEKSLAAFDQINKLSSTPEADTPANAAVNIPISLSPGNVDTAVGEAESAATRLSEVFQKIFEPVRNAFDFSTVIGNCKAGFENLRTFFSGVFDAIGESVENMRETVVDAFNNLLGGVTTFVSSISTVVSGMFAIWTQNAAQWVADNKEKIKEVFDSFQQIIANILNLFGKIFSDIGESLTNWWNGSFAPIYDKLCKMFWDVVDILMDVWTNYISPVLNTVIAEAQRLWDNHLKPLFDDLLGLISAVGKFITTLWNVFLKPFVDKLVEQWGPAFKNVFSNVAKFVGDAVGVIVDVVRILVNNFKNILNFFTSVFEGDWEDAWKNVKKAFSDAWEGMWNIAKGIVNLIIDAINALWSGLYNSLRNVVNGVGGIVSKIGDLLGQDWGFSIPETPPMIPRLATGAVIPPNQEFLAVLGDQRRGRNIEAPEDLIRQIVREETGGLSQPTELVVTGNMSALMRYLNVELKREQRRASAFHD